MLRVAAQQISNGSRAAPTHMKALAYVMGWIIVKLVQHKFADAGLE